MKKLLILFVFALSSCRSVSNLDNIFIPEYNAGTIGTTIYDTNLILNENESKISYAEDFSLEEIYVKAINEVTNDYLTQNNKKYKRNLIIDYEYDYKGNETLSSLSIISYGILGLVGVPYNAITSEITVTAKLETLNGIAIKEYTSSATETEYLAPYYGYSSEIAARAISKSKAFQQSLFNILKQISEENNLDTLQKQTVKQYNDNIKKEQERERKRKERIKQQAEERKQNLILKYGERYAELILKQQIAIGMPEGALIESWGKPRDINESVGAWGVHKQYVYRSAYVYVENGEITSWQK